MININKLENLVGERFTSLQQLEIAMTTLLKRKVKCIESESDKAPNTDYMIDYEIEGYGDVYTLYYLRGRGVNKYYITEV